MKTIFKTEIKLIQKKYGFFLFFIPLYQFGKGACYFFGLSIFGVMAWQFINKGDFAQSVYEQLAVIVSFLCIYFFKNEKQYALVPYITKLTISKIRNYILIKDLFSRFNFILIPLVVSIPVLSNTIENLSITYFICLWLTGLFLNFLTRIIKNLCRNRKLLFLTILGIALAYSIILVWFYRTATVFSYSNFLNNGYYIVALLAGIALLIPSYFYVIKQELYQAYDGNHLGRKTIHNFNPALFLSNIFNKILLLKYLRCRVIKKKIFPMIFSYGFMGILVFYIMLARKQMRLGMLLCIYTFAMLPFTIYLSSNYFDGLYTKPISIKSLLLSSFYIHIVITTCLFIILLIFMVEFSINNHIKIDAFYIDFFYALCSF
jgi:hypothetical protein